jgi:hypothetical protein
VGKLTLSAGCLILLCVGWCLGKGQMATHSPGGGDWTALSKADRELYLSGFVEGYRQGTLHAGSAAIAQLAPQSVSSMTPAEKKDYQQQVEWAHKVSRFLAHPVSGDSLEATVTRFYGDYRNMPVCMDNAVLFSAASLGGSAASEQELAAARKRGVESGCK